MKFFVRDKRFQEIADTAIQPLKAKFQALIDDILSVQTTTDNYVGNEYTTYSQYLTAVDQKYNGVAKWGVLQTSNIIDILSAFTIGRGIDVVEEIEGSERELAFAREFLKYNKLQREMAQEFAKEANIEGRFLGKLIWEKEYEWINPTENNLKGMVKILPYLYTS
ncbi:MAG: hypothetical protein ACFFDN_19930, partial [Candidatus Hodarchaeota archaeon]